MSENIRTQTEYVLNQLRKRPITSYAMFRAGITRLSAVIYCLRKQGIAIGSIRKKVNTRWGKTTVSVYHLLDKPAQ